MSHMCDTHIKYVTYNMSQVTSNMSISSMQTCAKISVFQTYKYIHEQHKRYQFIQYNPVQELIF